MAENNENLEEQVQEVLEFPEDVKGDVFREAAYLQQQEDKKSKESKPAEEIEKKPDEVIEKKPDEQPTDTVVEDTISLKEIFGEQIPQDAKGQLKEMYNNHELTKKEYSALKQSMTTLEEENRRLKTETPFVDETLFKLNEIKKQKPDDYELYFNLAFNKLDNKEILKLKFLKENPEFKGREDDVNTYLEDTYGLDREYDEDNPQDMKDKKTNLMKFEIAAKSAQKELMKPLEDIKMPDKIDEAVLKAEKDKLEAVQKQELSEGWGKLIPEMVSKFEQLQLNVQGVNEKESREFMKYDVSPEIRTRYQNEVLEYMIDNKMPFKEESLLEAKQYVMQKFVLDQLPFLFQAVADKARSLTNEEWVKKTHNPSASQQASAKSPIISNTKTKNDEEEERGYKQGMGQN